MVETFDTFPGNLPFIKISILYDSRWTAFACLFVSTISSLVFVGVFVVIQERYVTSITIYDDFEEWMRSHTNPDPNTEQGI